MTQEPPPRAGGGWSPPGEPWASPPEGFPPARPAAGERRRAGKTFAQLFPQLFLFPLLIVTVGVLVYVFFVASAKDSRTIAEIIEDMQSGGEHARRQDAYTLATRILEQEARQAGQSPELFWDGLVHGELRRTPPVHLSEEETSGLVKLLERFPDDAELSRWVILALGRAGRPETTIPVLQGILSRDDVAPEVRVTACQALGLSRRPEAVAVLVEELRSLEDASAWVPRLLVLQALTNIGDAAAVPELRRHLGDPQRDVVWNAACWLAYFFRDPSGRKVLGQLLDWEFMESQPGDRGRPLAPDVREKFMRMALVGLYRLEGGGCLGEVRALADGARERGYPKLLRTALDILREHQRVDARDAADPQRSGRSPGGGTVPAGEGAEGEDDQHRDP